MEKLPKDVVQEMALELAPPDLIEFCLSSKQHNKIICQSEVFWRRKLERDYPETIYNVNFTEGKEMTITKKHISNPKAFYINKFTHISGILEELMKNMIDRFYGDQFHHFFNETYKSKLFKSLYKTYEELRKLYATTEDPHSDEIYGIIYDNTNSFFPRARITIDDEEDDPDRIIRKMIDDTLLNEKHTSVIREILKEQKNFNN